MSTKVLASKLSPFSARVRIAAALKGLDLSFEPAPGGTGSAELKALNPFGQVPTLLTGGIVLVESLALLDWLEDTWPASRSLRPADAANAARVRMIGLLFDNKVFPALRPLFAQLAAPKPEVAVVHAALDAAASELEKLAVFFDAEGPVVGGQLSNADCAMAPFAWLLSVLAPRFCASSPFERVPRLAQWWQMVGAVPEVQQVTASLQQAFAEFMATRT